jgi:hypothetical protein
MTRPNLKSNHVMNPEEPPKISLRWRITLLVAVWVITTIATVEGGIALLLYAWMFPSGLLALFVPKDWDPPISEVVILIMGWALYVGLTVFTALQKRRTCYFIIFGILCVLLALNVAGCHVMLREPIMGGD